MDTLPSEVLLLLLAQLDRQSLSTATRTCRAWNSVLGPFLWHMVYFSSAKESSLGTEGLRKGIQRYSNYIERLIVTSYNNLGPFLQLQDQNELEDQDEEKEEGRVEKRRPCLQNLIELYLDRSELTTTAADATQEREMLLQLTELFENNPSLRFVRLLGQTVLPGWSYKKLLGPFLYKDIGHGLRDLSLTVRMPTNDPKHPLIWLMKNLPRSIEVFTIDLQFGMSRARREEPLKLGPQEAIENAWDDDDPGDDDNDALLSIPLALKSLNLEGSYPLPAPGLDESPKKKTRNGGEHTSLHEITKNSPFLIALEHLLRRSQSLESLLFDMIQYGTVSVTDGYPENWWRLDELFLLLPLVSQSLSKFTTYSPHSDDALATLLNDRKLLAQETADDHKGADSAGKEKGDSHGDKNLAVNAGWSELSLSFIDSSYIKTSAAILRHVQTFESLTLDDISTGFPSGDLARIFRTAPRLRCLHVINDQDAHPTTPGHEYRNASLDVQDLLLHLEELDLFWSAWIERDKIHPRSLGWHPHAQENGTSLSNWACTDSMEQLWVMIKNLPRPDLTKSQYGGRLGRSQNGTLAHQDYTDPRVAVQVEMEICRRIGKMTRLKELVLGIDDRNWGDQNAFRDLPKNLIQSLGIEWDGEGASVRYYFDTIGSENGENGEEGYYLDSEHDWAMSRTDDVPLMFHDTGFQYSCLSLSLEAGLGLLEGLKNLEVLSVERMSHRIRLQEVQWMAQHWPRLRKIVGLAMRPDDRCSILPETDEAVQWLYENCPWIELPLSVDNMRQRSWTTDTKTSYDAFIFVP